MFTGIKSREIKDHKDDYYRGSPCLYRKHSGSYGTAHSWRDSTTHACLECIEDIKAGHFSLDLSQYTNKALIYVKRFWKTVDIEESENCWPWKGKLSKTNHLFFLWKRPEISSTYKVHPIRALNWICRGDIGFAGIYSRCGERRCSHPLHQLPDFLDKVDITPNEFNQQRLLLIEQLKEEATPKFSESPREIVPTMRVEAAYEKALRFYSKKFVRHLVK